MCRPHLKQLLHHEEDFPRQKRVLRLQQPKSQVLFSSPPKPVKRTLRARLTLIRLLFRKMQAWRYSSHQGNWWMNDHVGATVFGLCRRTENRELKKGTYYVRAYIDNARYDLYTGSNQYGSFTVDEVMKY